MLRTALVVALSCALACASAQAAEEGQEVGAEAPIVRPDVGFVGAPPGRESYSRVRRLLDTVRPRIVPRAVGDLASLLPEPSGPDGPSVIGASVAAACSEPMTASDYDRLMRELARSVTMMDPTAERADQLRDGWSCLTEPVAPEPLARVDFLDAFGRAEADGHDVARVLFQRALVIEPDLPWQSGRPPTLHGVFPDARRAAEDAAIYAIRLVVEPGSFVWIDGRRIDQPLVGSELRAGAHIVQIRRPGESGLRSLVVTTAGGPILVVDPPGLARAVDDEDHEDRLLAVLTAMERAGLHTPVFLVSLGVKPEAYRWEPELGSLGPAGWTPPPPRPGAVAGGVLVTIGGGLVSGGGVAAGVSYHRARELEDGWGDSYGEYRASQAEYFRQMGVNQASWAVIGVGAGAVAIGVVLAVSAHQAGGPDDERRPGRATAVELRPGLTFGRETVRVEITGRF